MIKEKNKPPKFAALLLRFLINHKHPEEMIGDYEEQYNQIASAKGKFLARLWYRLQIIAAIPAFVNNSIFWSFIMFRNYLKIMSRNIRKQKLFSIINITGFSAGLACSLMIMLWVQDELSYDKFHENAGDIYRIAARIETPEGEVHLMQKTPSALRTYLKENFPEVDETSFFLVVQKGWLVTYKNRVFTDSRVAWADPAFFKIFDFPFIRGDIKTSLDDIYSILFTEDMAEKFFGDENPVGKTVKIHGRDFTVTGLIKNIPHNSHLQFDCVLPYKFWTTWGYDLNSWTDEKHTAYVKLKKGSDSELVRRKINAALKNNNPQSGLSLYLQPVTDIHLYRTVRDNYEGQGNILFVYIFSLLAFFVLMIACINYMNLTTARSFARLKEVGVRKVIGANRTDLVKQFLSESVFFVIISMIVALILVLVLAPVYSSISGKEFNIDFSQDWKIIIQLTVVTLFTGIISGSYPAVFLSSFKPVSVLKNVFTTSRSIMLRKILVIAQFAVTIIIVFSTLVIFHQLEYIRNKDLGFNKEHLICFLKRGQFNSNYEAAKTELLRHPDIENVTASPPPFWVGHNESNISWEGKIDDYDFSVRYGGVGYDFLETFNINLVEGRFFSKEFQDDTDGAFVLNEKAIKMMGLKSPLGKKVSAGNREGKIIGIVQDYHFNSLHEEMIPMILYLERGIYVSVRLKSGETGISGAIEFLSKKWKDFVPGYPFDFEFAESVIDGFYRSEAKMAEVFKYFMILAAFVSCLGLYGLASFSAERRTKELGIRKILGAKISSIIRLLSKEFLIIVTISNIIAWPIAYLFMNKWLQNFAYRKEIGLEIFLSAGLIALVITFLTVSWQSVKAATANPVESLRDE
ncbi:ABC transporter permease [candidate division KSB1 bacterium]